MRIFAAAALAAASAPEINPRAVELFEREPALMAWALKYHDSDGDGRLSAAEAHRAAEQFKTIADGDGDGRVSPYEYARAIEFIIARYAVGG